MPQNYDLRSVTVSTVLRSFIPIIGYSSCVDVFIPNLLAISQKHNHLLKLPFRDVGLIVYIYNRVIAKSKPILCLQRTSFSLGQKRNKYKQW